MSSILITTPGYYTMCITQLCYLCCSYDPYTFSSHFLNQFAMCMPDTRTNLRLQRTVTIMNPNALPYTAWTSLSTVLTPPVAMTFHPSKAQGRMMSPWSSCRIHMQSCPYRVLQAALAARCISAHGLVFQVYMRPSKCTSAASLQSIRLPSTTSGCGVAHIEADVWCIH